MPNIAPSIISGLGSLSQLSDLRAKYPHAKNIMLITGKASYEASGAKRVVDAVLAKDSVIIFNDFEVNPKIEDVEGGVALARETAIDLIIAVGGGSVMDMGKLIKACYAAPNRLRQVARGEVAVTDPKIPLITIPTTAGSGSEATQFAVVYLGLNKYSLASPCLLPDAVILDGRLVASGSRYQKACNGLDALAQAIESAWAVDSTDASRADSFLATRLCVDYLESVVSDKADDAALQGMIEAANLAGKAINVSKTTAPHAWSYGITSHYGVPHGHAIWLTLPAIFQIHAQADEAQITDMRGVEYLRGIVHRLMQILSIPSASRSASVLRDYVARIGVDPHLSRIGADTVDKRRLLSEQVNMERMANNPVALGGPEIAHIFGI